MFFQKPLIVIRLKVPFICITSQVRVKLKFLKLDFIAVLDIKKLMLQE